MNHKEWVDEVNIKYLDEKKDQTTYKIKYIQEYAKLWIIVSTQRSNVKNINFIDCMCNAGIYKDGDLCTAMEVLSLFVQYADRFPFYIFNLFLNDNDSNRVESTKIIAKKILNGKHFSNINVYFSNTDVNQYLTTFSNFDIKLKDAPSTLNFIDPYNFGDVKLDSIRSFINRYYCEVAFNLFTSDFVRNKTDPRIKKCLGVDIDFSSKEEFVEYVISKLKISSIKFAFPFVFKISTNTELYQILFLTPNLRGLEKLKEALRFVFKGMEEYKNTPFNPQGELFTLEDSNIEENVLLNCGKKTQTDLLHFFEKQRISYKQIESFVLEKSVLAEHHIIRYIILPLIESGKIHKCNTSGKKSNFKQDEYEIGIKNENNYKKINAV